MMPSVDESILRAIDRLIAVFEAIYAETPKIMYFDYIVSLYQMKDILKKILEGKNGTNII